MEYNVRCSCLTTCSNNKCSCFANGRKCNSRCHAKNTKCCNHDECQRVAALAEASSSSEIDEEVVSRPKTKKGRTTKKT